MWHKTRWVTATWKEISHLLLVFICLHVHPPSPPQKKRSIWVIFWNTSLHCSVQNLIFLIWSLAKSICSFSVLFPNSSLEFKLLDTATNISWRNLTKNINNQSKSVRVKNIKCERYTGFVFWFSSYILITIDIAAN